MVPPDDCIRARESISARLDGELNELDLARLTAHLRECPACALQAHELAGVVGRLRAATLEQPDREIRLGLPGRRQAYRIRATAAVAVAAAAVVVAGGLMQHRGQPVPSQAASESAAHHRLMEQRLVAMLSSLDAAPTNRQGRFLAV